MTDREYRADEQVRRWAFIAFCALLGFAAFLAYRTSNRCADRGGVPVLGIGPELPLFRVACLQGTIVQP